MKAKRIAPPARRTHPRRGALGVGRARIGALAPSALLELMRLASPSLPVGGFSYSEAIESAVEARLVVDEATAARWLVDQLGVVLARCDLPIVARALAAWRRGDLAQVAVLNRWVASTRETSELRLQSAQMGRSLVEWLRHREDAGAALAMLDGLDPPTWPIAFALAASASGAPALDVLVAYAAGWAENMTQAALKAVPLGQVGAQRILAALAREIPPAVDAALALPAGEMQAFAPMLAILSSQHETQYSRLFRS